MLVLALLAGCHSHERAEAQAVLHELEVLRSAPKDQKQGPAEALAKVACTAPVVCEARDRCVEVYQHLARGMEAQERVAAELGKLEASPPIPKEKILELSAEVDRADREVDDAKAGLAGCEQAASLMRRLYGI